MITSHLINCPKCQGQAYIYAEEGRYFVDCVCCGYRDYLKDYARIKKDSKRLRVK